MQFVYLQLLLLMMSITSVFAQKHIILLEEGSEKPVSDAYVQWQSLHGAREPEFTVSDEQGGIDITSNEDRLVLVVSRIGYVSVTDTFDMKKVESIDLKRDVHNIDQVVVTGTRTVKRLADVPVKTTVISASQIRKSGAVSVLETLEDYMPGVVTESNAMGNNMRIKGLNSRHILFLVDGERLVAEGAGGNINFDQINVNSIERIEIVDGAASALYGSNAIGGVINIITKKPMHYFDLGVNTSYQSHNTIKLQTDVGVNREKVLLRAGVFRNSSDGFDLDNGPYAARYTDFGGDVTLGYKFSKRIRTNFVGRYFQHERFNRAISMDVKHDLNRKLTLGANGNVESRDRTNDLKISVNFDKFYSYDVMEKKNDDLEEGFNASYLSSRLVDRFSNDDQWELVGGLEYNYEQITTKESKTLGEIPTKKSVNDVNVFGQFQYTFFRKVDVVAGARYTYNSQFNSAFSPSLSMMYRSGCFKVRGGLGRSFRAPSIKELYYKFDHQGSFWIFGNPDLNAEHGVYSSLSIEFSNDKFNVSLGGYHNQIDDKITGYVVIEDGKDNRYYKNVSSATLKGIDLNVSCHIIKPIVLKGSYSYCDAQDDLTGLQLESNVKHSGTVALNWSGDILQSPLSVQFTGRMNSPRLYQSLYIDDEGNEALSLNESDSYSIWKVTLVKPLRIKKHQMELTFKCDNIFEFKEQDFINPGRQYLLGVRYRFQ
ncbi:TonB-dependent receptor [Puteibacter caeruleilacunae]|nr:TonB-dependent receptor [Puteibacter caeruleilacunae]